MAKDKKAANKAARLNKKAGKIEEKAEKAREKSDRAHLDILLGKEKKAPKP